MPSYLSPLHGVTQSWEFVEAAAIAPLGRATLNCFELYHPASGRHRFVADYDDLMATLEADAPADAGLEVLWLGAPLMIDWPDENDSETTPEIMLTLDNVAGKMMPELKKARGYIDPSTGELVPWVLTERIYNSDDTGGPARLPVTVKLLSSVEIAGSAIILRAFYGDSGNFGVPRQTFRGNQYPGLER